MGLVKNGIIFRMKNVKCVMPLPEKKQLIDKVEEKD